VKVEYKL